MTFRLNLQVSKLITLIDEKEISLKYTKAKNNFLFISPTVPMTFKIAIDWPPRSHHEDHIPRDRRCHRSLHHQHRDTKSNQG